MAVNDILELGRQGLNANRQALQTTSNNVANANTPGYTRRKAMMETPNTALAQSSMMGAGVEVKKVIRVHDDFVQKQIVDESQALGGLRSKSESLHRLENVVAKDADHLSSLVNKFFNDYRELSANPETGSLRDIVGASAESLGSGMRRMNDSLDSMKVELDLKISNTVEQVNSLTSELAGLNNSITSAEARGDIPNDLYDKRDAALRQLSQKMDVQVSTNENGQVNVVAAGTVLVQGSTSLDLTVTRTPESGTKGAGQLDIFIKHPISGGADRPITAVIRDGELGGMLHVRDKVVDQAQRDLDKVAFRISKSVNDIHKQGVGRDGIGERELFNDLGTEERGAAFRFGISDQIKSNREAIAVGLSADAIGDNQIALNIANLQNLKEFAPTEEDGVKETRTFNESIHALVGRIGVETQNQDSFYQHQQAVVDQLENYRQSVSGVSLEEEAINMIQYQAVFNASAKAMKVGQELFETILSLKD
jgi:flagellar hook-associated protein 1